MVRLTRKHGGLLWGEHGKGVRSEYSREFFGPLYPLVQAVKAAFDPRNQLNPGKIASPDGSALLTIDGLPTRGQADRTIPPPVRAAFDEAMHCNGNGACYDWDPDQAMCPSWKGMRERRHSPKGRAMLLKEWLRRLSAAGVDPVEETRRLRATAGWRTLPARLRNTLARRRGEPDFSHEVKEAMDGCLACKSCVGGCPIKVNVPSFRAKFLELYHGRYLRPARDYLVASLEHLLPAMARMPRLYNGVVGSGMGGAGMRLFGLVDTPRLSGIDLGRELAARGLAFATPEALRKLGEAERRKAVVVVQDAFTSHYETRLVLDVLDLIRLLGFTPWLAPFRPNGKALHVHGFLGAFGRVAAANVAALRELAATGVDLVGIDPSMTLTFRAEYAEALGGQDLPRCCCCRNGWRSWPSNGPRAEAARYRLLPHCTERTTATAALRDWQAVFARHGLQLDILAAGCCGMAGTYGHEAEHRAMSERIYGLSWGRHVASPDGAGRLLATGYSCRSQAKRLDGVALPHPAQALLQALRPANTADAPQDRRAARVLPGQALHRRKPTQWPREATRIEGGVSKMTRKDHHRAPRPARGRRGRPGAAAPGPVAGPVARGTADRADRRLRPGRRHRRHAAGAHALPRGRDPGRELRRAQPARRRRRDRLRRHPVGAPRRLHAGRHQHPRLPLGADRAPGALRARQDPAHRPAGGRPHRPRGPPSLALQDPPRPRRGGHAARPGTISVGSSGVGTDDHLGLTLLQAATGTEFIHAPYAGAGLVKNAVLAGHIDVAGLNLGEAGILKEEKPQLRALAAMGEKRWELMPNVPTFREEGVDVVMTSERGLAAPRGIPDEIATRLQDAIARVMAKPEWLEKAKQLELPLAYLPGAEWEAQMPAQEARYRRIWEATPWN